MPEIGLLPLARVAMDVATAVLPPYRSRFSKHPFPQPQVLAILCLLRYADGTFREAEVRLREPSEWRALLRLWSGPDPPPCSDSCVDCRTTPWTTCWENRYADCAAVRDAADA